METEITNDQAEKSIEEKEEDKSGDSTDEETLIGVYDQRPQGYDGTCLRPLGLCDLGGCCDSCWYSPDHPRHKKA